MRLFIERENRWRFELTLSSNKTSVGTYNTYHLSAHILVAPSSIEATTTGTTTTTTRKASSSPSSPSSPSPLPPLPPLGGPDFKESWTPLSPLHFHKNRDPSVQTHPSSSRSRRLRDCVCKMLRRNSRRAPTTNPANRNQHLQYELEVPPSELPDSPTAIAWELYGDHEYGLAQSRLISGNSLRRPARFSLGNGHDPQPQYRPRFASDGITVYMNQPRGAIQKQLQPYWHYQRASSSTSPDVPLSQNIPNTHLPSGLISLSSFPTWQGMKLPSSAMISPMVSPVSETHWNSQDYLQQQQQQQQHHHLVSDMNRNNDSNVSISLNKHMYQASGVNEHTQQHDKASDFLNNQLLSPSSTRRSSSTVTASNSSPAPALPTPPSGSFSSSDGILNPREQKYCAPNLIEDDRLSLPSQAPTFPSHSAPFRAENNQLFRRIEPTSSSSQPSLMETGNTFVVSKSLVFDASSSVEPAPSEKPWGNAYNVGNHHLLQHHQSQSQQHTHRYGTPMMFDDNENQLHDYHDPLPAYSYHSETPIYSPDLEPVSPQYSNDTAQGPRTPTPVPMFPIQMAPESQVREKKLNPEVSPSTAFPPLPCTLCGKEFHGKFQKSNRKRHFKQVHSQPSVMDDLCKVTCQKCGKLYQRSDAKRKHEWEKHQILGSKAKKRRVE